MVPVAKTEDSFAQRLVKWFTGEEDTNATTVLLPSQDQGKPLQLPKPMGARYEIIKVLGKGAFGIVYLAHDQRIGRLLAVKQLFSKFRGSAEIHHRFLQEARIAGQMDNPNIVTIYDVEDEGVPCILMEYLGGGNLATILKLDAPLPELTALAYLRGILSGLGAAHRMGVVHRDIKPQNILFDQNGTPKISDFGIAHLPVEAGGLDDAKSGQVAGTPDYMAPEQMRPGARIDARADLYACGLLLYEMLAGRKLYTFGKRRDLKAMSDELRRAGGPKDREFPVALSASARELIRRLVQPDPDRRLADAATVLQKLETLAAESSQFDEAKLAINEEAQVRREMFQDILRLFLVDGVISAPERRELVLRSRRLGIEPNDAIRLEELVRHEFGLPLIKDLQEFDARVEKLLAAGPLTAADRRALRLLGEQGNVSLDEQRKIEENVMIRLQMKDGVAEELIP